MKKRILLAALVISFLVFFLSASQITDTPHYGHITLTKGEVTIKRSDGTINKATVNLPIVAGDLITTAKDARCELQFDNGTIIRLDNNTELTVNLISAKSLVSSKKLTSLLLKKGKLYSMINTYNREIFEIQTPNANVLMHNNSTNILAYYPVTNNTSLFVKRGKVKIRYGKDVKHLITKKIKKGNAVKIVKDYALSKADHTLFKDFLAWNKSVNDNFKKLHYGKSVVPKVIYRYPLAIVKFAEKWSSLYGEWVYDKIFGYVWVPADEFFKYDRPFIFADYYKINGKIFVVPKQEWSWVPAHLGTWHWSKERGWIWIPGSVFKESWIKKISSGENTIYAWNQDFIDQYIVPYWGSIDLYLTYRNEGIEKWREEYKKKFGRKKSKPDFEKVPKEIRKIFKKLDNTSYRIVKRYVQQVNYSKIIPQNRIRLIHRDNDKFKNGKIIISDRPINYIQKNSQNIKENVSSKIYYPNFRSFSEDAKWAFRRKIKLKYDSKTNSVICPRLGISSNRINVMQRRFLKNTNITATELISISSNGNIFSSSESNNNLSPSNSNRMSVGTTKQFSNISYGTGQFSSSSKQKEK